MRNERNLIVLRDFSTAIKFSSSRTRTRGLTSVIRLAFVSCQSTRPILVINYRFHNKKPPFISLCNVCKNVCLSTYLDVHFSRSLTLLAFSGFFSCLLVSAHLLLQAMLCILDRPCQAPSFIF